MRRADSFCKNELARLKEPAHFQLRSCNKEGILTLFRVGIFGAAHGCGGEKKAPHNKIYHTYPTMMKLGTVIPCLKKIQKIYKSCEISNFCCIKKYTYRLHLNTCLILWTFFESLRVALINVVAILMTSAKLATPGLLKIKVF